MTNLNLLVQEINTQCIHQYESCEEKLYLNIAELPVTC